MSLAVGTLDESDQELARQAEDRDGSEAGRDDEIAGEHATTPSRARVSLKRRRAVEVQQREHADRRECQQLDDRLEGDRQHDALVVLGRVEPARAEQDREQRHQQRDPQRRVGEPADVRAPLEPVSTSMLVPTALYCNDR